MAKFILVRHGETDWNARGLQQGWLDSELTELGVSQARQVAAQLPPGTKQLFVSDLGRAQRTAQIIAQDLPGVSLFTDWRLRERAYGEMAGQPKDTAAIDKSFEDAQASYMGTEPVAHMNERLKSFVRDCAAFDYQHYVLITHSGVISRFGYMFHDDFVHSDHLNSSIHLFEIDLRDPRLQPADVTPWRPSA